MLLGFAFEENEDMGKIVIVHGLYIKDSFGNKSSIWTRFVTFIILCNKMVYVKRGDTFFNKRHLWFLNDLNP